MLLVPNDTSYFLRYQNCIYFFAIAIIIFKQDQVLFIKDSLYFLDCVMLKTKPNLMKR